MFSPLLRRAAALVLAFSVFGLGSGPATVDASPAPTAIAQTSDEATFVRLINELRTEQGLAPLEVHPTLVPLARDWATQLRAQNALSHAEDLSVGIDLTWTRLGENVGVGPADQVQEIFDAFVASPSHYANLVRPDYGYIGVGVVYGDDGRIWTAHRFMALDESTVPPTTDATPEPDAGNASVADVPNAAPPTTAPPNDGSPAESSTTTTEPRATIAPLQTEAPPATALSEADRAVLEFLLAELEASGI